MTYTMIKSKDSYDIHETTSDVVIELETAQDKAKTICRKLNLGAGFNGWTPPFFADFNGLQNKENVLR